MIGSCELLGNPTTEFIEPLGALLDTDDHVKKIVERNVDIDYSVVFKNVSDNVID